MEKVIAMNEASEEGGGILCFFFSVLKSGEKMVSIRSGINVANRMMSARRSLKSKLWFHLFCVAA